MKNIVVPPAPTATGTTPKRVEEREFSQANARVATNSPLDAAFLKRVYVSLLVVGIGATVWATLSGQNTPVLTSFVVGYALAAVLLKVQEITVRGLLKPNVGADASLAKMGALLLMPLKFVVVAAVLVGMNMLGVLAPVAMIVGFSLALAVVVAKLGGFFLVKALRAR